jgi:hypothetical protein
MKLILFLLFPLGVFAADNSIYIEQVGDNNQIILEQKSYLNTIGNFTEPSRISGTYNSVTVIQDSNNSAQFDIVGNFNMLSVIQSSSQSMQSTVNGNNNTLDFTQLNTANKSINSSVTGNNNNVVAVQEGQGQHQLSVTLSGNGHTVNSSQKDSGNHSASIILFNSGGPATVNLTQQGVVNQTYSITQSCALLNGCTTTVNQQ